jgi:hypothetical protein
MVAMAKKKTASDSRSESRRSRYVDITHDQLVEVMETLRLMIGSVGGIVKRMKNVGLDKVNVDGGSMLMDGVEKIHEAARKISGAIAEQEFDLGTRSE